MHIMNVTVLINTYNHEKFIRQALESVLDQDYPRDQLDVVVVDDGSSDSTFSIIEQFASRVRCIQKPNGGQVSTLSAALPNIRGEIIAFLDGDDSWAPSKLRKVVDAFARFQLSPPWAMAITK